MLGFIGSLILITRGGDVSRIVMMLFLPRKGPGWGDSLGIAVHASRLHVSQLAGTCVHA